MRVEGSRRADGDTVQPIDVAPWERGLVLTDHRPCSIRDALHEVARTLPDHLAVDDGTQQLTYAEFVRDTERVARSVRAADGDHSAPVTVVVAHGADALVALVGVIVSGRIAVPVDRRDPVERLRATHQAAGSSLVISGLAGEGTARAVAPDTPVVVVDDSGRRDDRASTDNEITIDPESLATIFFTSGSTGVPKGVAKTHRNAVINAYRFAYLLGLTPDDHIGIEGSFSFGVPYTRACTGLLNGVALYLRDTSRGGARETVAWLNETGITLTSLVPSVFRAIAAAAPEARMPSIRNVTFLGESLFGPDVRSARRMFGRDTQLDNRLTSTEAGTACTWVITPDDEATEGPVPVGHAVPWLELRIVDDEGNDVPEGDPGVMVVIDDHIAVGYWRDPELTAERFFTVPDGRRAFRTSDRVRLRPDGVLEHLGRADDRVKVRGAMASPAEVERALMTLDGVSEAAVVATPTSEGGTRLVAYVVPDPGMVPGSWQIRRELASRLPSHMVPGPIVMLDALPLGARGKIDRSALPPLPAPTSSRAAVGRERAVAELFCDVLGLDGVGVDDDFFDLGGDSLAAIELVSAITERFGVDIETSVLLDAPSVAALAPRLVNTRRRGASCAVRLCDGEGTPFFCVAGGGSPAVSLRALADAIGKRPCYGIQARGLEERARPDRNVEACARRYLAEVRAIQPHGPYLLGGHSFGGLVAFEMACRLEAAGEPVALLALIDTFLHEPVLHDPVLDAPPRTRGLHARLSWMRSQSRARWLTATAGVVPRGVRQYRVFSLLSNRAGRAYRPTGRYAGNALLAFQGPADPAWESLLTLPLATIDVPGDHVTMLRRPYVGLLGAQLARALADNSAGSTP